MSEETKYDPDTQMVTGRFVVFDGDAAKEAELRKARERKLPPVATGNGSPIAVVVDTNPKSKFGATKPSVALIPPVAKLHCATALEHGEFKYGDFNWRKDPVSIMTYLNAAMRHIDAFLDGEELTSDGGVHNLGGAMACCAIVLDAAACGTLVDDRPPQGKASAVQDSMRAAKPALLKRWQETRDAARGDKGEAA